MAKFKPRVLALINAIEGGWVDDPDDNGRETWRGFARAYNPKSPVWPVIDDIKKRNPVFTKQAYAGRPQNLNKLLYANKYINDIIDAVYERDYFNINRLQDLNDQQLAENVADCGVNCGTGTAARMLQKAFNISHSPNIKAIDVDGKIGNATINSVNSDVAELIYRAYNQLRKAYYDNLIAKNPVYAKYKKSWYSRIKPYVA